MIKSIVINNLKKIYNYVLTHSYNYDIFISTTKQKATAPGKVQRWHQSKKER